jgi:hypothetical protein
LLFDPIPNTSDWSAVPSVEYTPALSPLELIHAQGLAAPPLIFATVRDLESVGQRPYFSMPIPAADQSGAFVTTLNCRKKSSEEKYRFVYATFSAVVELLFESHSAGLIEIESFVSLFVSLKQIGK